VVADTRQTPLRDPASNDALLADRYRIEPASPLSDLDIAGATTFSVHDVTEPERPLMARICAPGVVPRVHAMIQIKPLQVTRLMESVDWGAVYWPPARERRFAAIFERPGGEAVMSALDTRIAPFKPDRLGEMVLAPITLILANMYRRGIPHRAIRPDNIFWSDSDQAGIILGECVSTPPAWGQPAAVETIETMMTPPSGRGPGGVEDDLYALGATILFLGLGYCPVADLTEKALLEAKVTKGSFTALLNGEAPPMALRDPLRGLLADDPANRWTLEDIEQWLSGTVRKSVQPTREIKVDRAFAFGGEEFRNCRLLAHALGERWQDSPRIVRGSAFENWIQRGIPDPAIQDAIRLEMELAAEAANSKSQDSKLVSRVCMRLDPLGPVRYKGLVLQAGGIGNALNQALHGGAREDVQRVAELINNGLLIDWYAFEAAALALEPSPQTQILKRLQQYLRQSGPGYGIERCYYEINPFAPCLSPMLEGAYVSGLGELLRTLESIVEEKGALPNLIDRHVAAFIAGRSKKSIDQQLRAMEEGPSDPIAKLSMLHLLAKVQYEWGPANAPHLTHWLAQELEPLAKRFASRTLREDIVQKLARIGTGGSLVDLFNLLSNENLFRRDQAGQVAAAREYGLAARQIDELRSNEYQDTAQRTGWRIASAISMLITVLTFGATFAW
jgi:eukaryotic-like serine/threonine-protein kinase